MWNGAARLKNHTDEQLRHLDICKEGIESPWKFLNCSFDWMLISLSLSRERTKTRTSLFAWSKSACVVVCDV